MTRNHNTIIVGLSGSVGSGKTWLAKYAEDAYGALRMSLADPLKDDVVRLGFDADLVRNKKPPYIRHLLQAYGQAGREADPDWWLDKLFNRIDQLYDDQHLVFVDDVRYPNEAMAIQDAGGLVFCVINTGGKYPYPGCDHVSERSLDQYAFNAHIVAGPGETDKLSKQLDNELRIRGVII